MSYRLPARKGGRMAKVAMYMVKVLNANDTTNVRVTVDLEHGPDGQVSVLHSVCINAANPGGTFPTVLSGQADTSIVIGEWLHPVIKIAHQAVFEMRQPF